MEKAIVATANLLQTNGFVVSILVLDEHQGSFFPLHKEVSLQYEQLDFGITPRGNFLSRKLNFLQHIQRLKKKLMALNPDTIIATEYPFSIAAKLAAQHLFRLFAWEHHHYGHLKKSKFWKSLQRKIYSKLDGVICLNADEAAWYAAAGCNAMVIPNFVQQAKQATLTAKTLLTVGWLSKTKGIDFVPAIAEKVFSRYPAWHWKIVGTGSEQATLEAALRARNLRENVHIVAPTSPDLSAEYLSAAVYVMPSRFECFPMVLLEAMAHGVPCIAFDCPTGPRHIISANNDGMLVPAMDVNRMAQEICYLIENEEKRQQLGANAYAAIDRFAPGHILSLWKNLLRTRSASNNHNPE